MDDIYDPDPAWPQLPTGQQLGQVTGVAVSPAGEVYVIHRGTPPVLVFDRDGRLLRAWGSGEIPDGGGHFLRLDPDGNPWLTDTKRHQVLRFDQGGRLLSTLGRRGEPGDAPDQFDMPTDLAFLPSGDFFVSDGYGNTRIKRYGADGELVTMWGTPGRQAGEFDTPHAICVDSRGNLYVSDRGNSRIQVFDLDGRFQREWRSLPYIDGMACAADDTLVVATGRANGVMRLSTVDHHGGEPKVLDSVGSRYSTYQELMDHAVPPHGQFNMIHGVAVDSNGDLYVAEVRARRVQRLIRRKPE